MKKVIFYTTTIYDTFFSNESMYLRDLEMKKMVLNLEKIRILHHADLIYFDFIISGDKEVLKIFLKEFEPYCKGSLIYYGNHLYNDGILYYDGHDFYEKEKQMDKISFLFSELKNIENKYQVISTYYADNSLQIQEKLCQMKQREINQLIPCMVPNVNKEFYTSTLSSLEGVNECLSHKMKTLIKKVI